MFRGTIGPQDALYLPAGYTFVERVGRTPDCYGIRYQFLTLEQLSTLEAINDVLITMKKPNTGTSERRDQDGEEARGNMTRSMSHRRSMMTLLSKTSQQTFKLVMGFGRAALKRGANQPRTCPHGLALGNGHSC